MNWPKWFSRPQEHKAEIIGVQHVKAASGPLGIGTEMPMTIILARCVSCHDPDCGLVETKVIHGTWTQTQITGKSEADSLLNSMDLKVKE